MPAFKDRADAGRQLSKLLQKYHGRPDVLVLALPRGGVPVAYELACSLGVPLDVIVVRKLGVPGREELAMGAIAFGGVEVRNQEIIDLLKISDESFGRVAARERHELERREHLYRGNRAAPEVAGRTVILVDNGIATGSTMLAAIRALRSQAPEQIIVAIPVAPPDVRTTLSKEADEIHCLLQPDDFFGVGFWYENFSQTTDQEVQELLERSWDAVPSPAVG